MSRLMIAPLLVALSLAGAGVCAAETRIRIMPPDRSDFAVGQRFDIRVEATADAGSEAPGGLRVFVDKTDLTARNGVSAAGAPAARSTNFLLRGYFFARPGTYTVRATTADGATAQVTVRAHAWQATRAGAPRARNVILFLGDGMGMAHRTAARLVSRGIRDGKALAPLAMDTLEITGQVMTPSLNAAITDSAPGMSSYSTGAKGNNNQEGVYPDNTADAFDNPRVEYIGELLKRTRGRGFNVGIVTTADVTDATPGANAVHTSNRSASAAIAARFFDERATNGVAVLLGGGSRNFSPKGTPNSVREDARDLGAEFVAAGYTRVGTRTEVKSLLAQPKAPARVLGLFAPQHMSVAFDKVGAGTYSSELALEKNAALRDQPMLDEMTRLALRSLGGNSPAGFYLIVEGASIDKQSHAADSERMVWDTIEFDNAVRAGLEFADRTNRDADPNNDTLVIVTADHETGDLGIVGVGNERYAPTTFGEAVRDYAAVFRFAPEQVLDFVPNYKPDAQGFPVDPDPSRKLLFAWGASPDRFENWLSNRLAQDGAVAEIKDVHGPGGSAGTGRVSVANPKRDGSGPDSDNKSVSGVAVPGFLVAGVIENGEHGCLKQPGCPADTSSDGHTFSGHTASDVPLSATGPGALQFTGVYENTDVFLKILKSTMGSYPPGVPRRR